MSKLQISLCCGAYDRTAAILDGSVGIEGCDVVAHALTPEESFFRCFRHHEFDVAELSLSTYLLTHARGESAYIAIPAFVSRSFRHSAIYINRKSGIRTPEDLRGKVVGVPEYQVTAAVWVREHLEVDHRVRPADITWRTGGVEEPGRHEKARLDLPEELSVTPIPADRTLNDMLLNGEIDALVCPRAPSSYGKGVVVRLFDDPAEAAADYFGRHRAFPIMHVVGVRRTLAEKHPWLPGSVYKAFSKARAIAMEKLADTTALAVSLPWLVEEAERTAAIMGPDFWPYGISAADPTIERFLDAHHAQGLSSRRFRVEEIFHPGTLERAKV